MTMNIPNHATELLAPDRVRSRWILMPSRGLAFLSLAARYFEKRRSRIALSELSDEQLQDIGVTRSEARSEVSKSWFLV
ncbi:DUF1127 domain-containing protein [Pararhizobium sp. LjRoot235]|uniref:DUF1127 domain-containing protein n=1 Tax=Pararhizobium sp. LjRoot235 TaxID=3342291 RepID=UPI003F4F40AF